MWSERVLLAVDLLVFVGPAWAQAPHYGLGRTPAPAEIAAWNTDVRADGLGLPPGHGSVASGREVFAQRCAACHGDKGQGGSADRLVGGFGTLSNQNPIKTVGSYWPYATTLFDFVRRAMPFNAPGTLSDDEIYAVSAYILALNGVIADDATLGPDNLSHIAMPNRNGFVSEDPRPDVR
jgi:mono/diheme cytochrome c family protein